ncbi:MAG: RagB/SusD family nutrient uptake outer membrane protein [Sphingobacteriaceae bacterium]
MKKITFIYMWSFLAIMLSSACNKNFLDTKPTTEFPGEDVWSDPALAQAYINDLYGRLPWGWAMTAGDVDESRSRDDANFDFNNMLITPDNAGWGDWGGRYGTIRACNIFLENADKIPAATNLVDGKNLKDRMVGEVTFLRAWNYHMLISYFGGVPLIIKSYNLSDDFASERNSYADCVKFVADECDKAAALLPNNSTGANSGRATKGAALALKSRLLLYAASDLHNTTKFSSFSKPELLGYTDANKADRWKAARDAAKAVIDLNLYSLYKPQPSSAEEATKNYVDLFISKQSEEDIFVRFFAASIGKGVNGWDVTPNGWWGNGGVGAINELVDDYEMSNGTRFNSSNSSQAAEPYKNRDPRFYATILHEGAKWRPRPSDLAGIDPVGVLQVGTWEKWDVATSKIVKVYGLDSRNSVANSWNNNTSGATMRKFLNPNVDIQATNQDLTWRYFRFGEILLNYAEACIELGEEIEARNALNQLRKRAAMPQITESGAALKARYRNERRVEMAYEDQRFFDVRRWMIGADAYHPVHGVQVTYKLNADKTTATIPTITPVQIMTGTWDEKAYFLPLSRDERNKNSKLVQNPGY